MDPFKPKALVKGNQTPRHLEQMLVFNGIHLSHRTELREWRFWVLCKVGKSWDHSFVEIFLSDLAKCQMQLQITWYLRWCLWRQSPRSKRWLRYCFKSRHSIAEEFNWVINEPEFVLHRNCNNHWVAPSILIRICVRLWYKNKTRTIWMMKIEGDGRIFYDSFPK